MADPTVSRLRLIRTTGIGPVTYRQLIARFGNAEAAIAALPMLAQRGGGRSPRIADVSVAEREIAATTRLGARYLFLDDPDYPRLLAEIETAPPGADLPRRYRARGPPLRRDGRRAQRIGRRL